MDVPLTMAISEYEHVRELASGRIKPEGVHLTTFHLPVEEIFTRFAQHQEWDVSEMSMGMYCAMRAADAAPVSAIPVFPSRMFRQSAVYVRADGPVRRPEDLAGRSIGAPQWSQTAAIYVRGWLAEDVGIDLRSIRWVQAGVDRPGRREPIAIALPEGFVLHQVPDRTLSEMLLAGDIDALLSTHPPQPFAQGNPNMVRLIDDTVAYERDYFARTGVFPIMHLVALRKSSLDANPWIAANLLDAFEAAKERCIERLRDVNISRLPVPWLAESVAAYRTSMFGGQDYWPYGLGQNHDTLATFLRYCHAQGVCRRLAPEELFPLEVQTA